MLKTQVVALVRFLNLLLAALLGVALSLVRLLDGDIVVAVGGLVITRDFVALLGFALGSSRLLLGRGLRFRSIFRFPAWNFRSDFDAILVVEVSKVLILLLLTLSTCFIDLGLFSVGLLFLGVHSLPLFSNGLHMLSMSGLALHFTCLSWTILFISLGPQLRDPLA